MCRVGELVGRARERGRNDRRGVSALQDLGGGMWRWALRHPEWHPRTALGAEVGCYAVHEGGGTVLIDPLLDEAVTAELDGLVRGEVVIAVTIPYHVRSACEAVGRWGGTWSATRTCAPMTDGTPFYGGDEPPLGLASTASRVQGTAARAPAGAGARVRRPRGRRRRRAARLARARAHATTPRVVRTIGAPALQPCSTWTPSACSSRTASRCCARPACARGRIERQPWYHRPS